MKVYDKGKGYDKSMYKNCHEIFFFNSIKIKTKNIIFKKFQYI